ncbi:MAG: hypothetical protein R2747_17385 [Pyrinomonadaceae bacterium]
MKKGMFIIGLILTIFSPFIGTPVFFLLGDTGSFLNLAEETRWILAALLIGTSVIIPIIGIALILGATLIPLISGMKKNKKILLEGLPAEARILAINDTGTLVNNNPLVNFILEVSSPSQPAFRAETRQIVPYIHMPSFQPGKLINVKYLPGTNQVAIVGAGQIQKNIF